MGNNLTAEQIKDHVDGYVVNNNTIPSKIYMVIHKVRDYNRPMIDGIKYKQNGPVYIYYKKEDAEQKKLEIENELKEQMLMEKEEMMQKHGMWFDNSHLENDKIIVAELGDKDKYYF